MDFWRFHKINVTEAVQPRSLLILPSMKRGTTCIGLANLVEGKNNLLLKDRVLLMPFGEIGQLRQDTLTFFLSFLPLTYFCIHHQQYEAELDR